MSKFSERHEELRSIIQLSRLKGQLYDRVVSHMVEACDNPTPEAVDEVLLLISEYELISGELREKVIA